MAALPPPPKSNKPSRRELVRMNSGTSLTSLSAKSESPISVSSPVVKKEKKRKSKHKKHSRSHSGAAKPPSPLTPMSPVVMKKPPPPSYPPPDLPRARSLPAGSASSSTLPTSPVDNDPYSQIGQREFKRSGSVTSTSTADSGDEPVSGFGSGDHHQRVLLTRQASLRKLDKSITHANVDVLKYMKRGAPFLKYGRRGYPHFRLFKLTEDNGAIIWYSRSKKLKDTQVPISAIQDVIQGQTTSNFRRHKAPELEQSSFSVLYGNGKLRTLDLIAKDPNEFAAWTTGLKALMSRVNVMPSQEYTDMSELRVSMPVRRGRRSTIAILKCSDVEPDLEMDTAQPRTDLPGNGVAKPADVRVALSTLETDFEAAKKQLNNKRFFEVEEQHILHRLANDVHDSLDRIGRWYRSQNYAACDDEIWRATVDLEALENMFDALKKT